MEQFKANNTDINAKTPGILNKYRVHPLAEREGFEPSRRY